MNKESILCLLTLLLTTVSSHSQSLLPTTVQQFLCEQSYSAQYRSVTSTAGDDLYRFVAPRLVDGTVVVDAFIGIGDARAVSKLQDLGVMINSLFDGFVTAQIPVDRLAQVSVMPGVTDVQISRRVKLCTDSTMSVTHAGMVMNGLSYGLPCNYDGTGVIVGVIDMGFDFQHRAFRSNQDPTKTRIVRVYHTLDNTGHKAKYNNNIVLPGSVFMGNEIYSLTTDKNGNTHGTHTASIAAGSHVMGYGGMAPESDIVMCAVSSIEGSVSEVEIANCIRYIDSYADSVGQPCVITLSVSTSNGQHDISSYFNKVVGQIMGPGRILVVAAGNSAGNKPYAHHKASPMSPLNLMFKCKNSLGGDSTYYYGSVLADIWMRSPSTNFYYKFHILDTSSGDIVWESDEFNVGTTVYASALSGYYGYYSAADTTGYIKAETSYVSSGKKYRLEIHVRNLISKKYTTVGGVKVSRYAIGVSVYPRRSILCDIDAWCCNSSARFGIYPGSVTTMNGSSQSDFYAAPSDSCCIGTYAIGDSTISVGAYSARNSYYSLSQGRVVTDYSFTVGSIAPFSGYQAKGAGPSGEPLPNICAPGTCVVAAGSRYSYFTSSPYTVMRSEGSYWGIMNGTSMAAPTVAGIIAQWLQANPALSVADVKNVISQTAIRDHYTFVKRDQFGPNGKIDAWAGLMLVLKMMDATIVIGDVNGDGVVTVSDVAYLINHLLAHEEDSLDLNTADLDQNGIINISDLTALVKFILND